jgi:hypothetical protein
MKSLIPPTRFFPLSVSILFLAVLSGGPPANAAIWQSSDYYCQVTLPDGSYVQQWYTMSPANESGALTGARRQDFGAIVYLGVVDVRDKPHFKLDDKSLAELEQGYFGPGVGFLHDTKPISLGGIKGYRLTGRHRFKGYNYGIVVDMYLDHGFVYQVAGLSELYENPLQDSDVRAYMQSFRIVPE